MNCKKIIFDKKGNLKKIINLVIIVLKKNYIRKALTSLMIFFTGNIWTKNL